MAAFALLASITVYFAYRFMAVDGLEAVHTWQGHAPIIALALVINLSGVALDSVCWLWTYRRCGIRVGGVLGLLVFLSSYAGQLMPAQTGRLVRPDAVNRLGLGRLRHAIEAEVSLVYLDLSAVATLVGVFALWQIHPLIGLVAGCVIAMIALGAAGLVSRLFPGSASALCPSLFWSFPGVACLVLRMADRALLGLVLMVLVRPIVEDIAYSQAALFALLGDSMGAASGMPGGLGVAEPMLGWLLSLAQMPEAHIVVAVVLFRLVTFWSMQPIGWAALLYVSSLPSASKDETSIALNDSLYNSHTSPKAMKATDPAEENRE